MLITRGDMGEYTVLVIPPEMCEIPISPKSLYKTVYSTYVVLIIYRDMHDGKIPNDTKGGFI
jgi:hypothetical protein